MAALLDIRDLRLHYVTLRGVVRAVDGVSFSIKEGEVLGVVGESGCGKTSLALALTRLLPRNVHLYEGKVSIAGIDLMALSDEEFRRRIRWRLISMVFQGAMNSLNPVMRVRDQVAEPLFVDSPTDKREAYAVAQGLLSKVGLPPDTQMRYPHELSGGMKQRVVIAMALVLRPKLVILDEPTSALDVSVQAQVTNLLKRLKREIGLSMIFITHDIALASDIADTLAVMYGGECVEYGPSRSILSSPKHPYTQKLLAAIPRLKSSAKPDFIPGAPPDLVSPPSGCRFHPRCPFAFDICSTESPIPLTPEQNHTVRCWLYKDRH